MMLNATQLKPKICLDCKQKLPVKYEYGIKFSKDYKRLSPIFVDGSTIWLPCTCGCIYVWSFDETFVNGGVWKRQHILPLFNDKLRLPYKVK